MLCGCSGLRKARDVKPGMTGADVEKIMGKPYMITTSGFDDVWLYQCTGWTLETMTVSFSFHNGKVNEVPHAPSKQTED